MINKKDFDVHPLVDVSEKKGKKISAIKVGIITILFSYLLIGYLFYDYYKEKKTEPMIGAKQEYLKVDEVIKKVEESLKSSLSLDIDEVKNEEELIKNIADKSINLPDLKQTIDKTLNLPPPSLPQPTTNQIQMPMSRYEYFLQKAKEYESMGNYRYAIFFYLRAFVENQSDYETKFKVAQLYYNLGQIPLAVESAKDSLKIKNDYLPALEFLAEIYLKSGYKDQQLKTYLEQGINKYQSNKTLISALAKIYKDENNIDAYNQIMFKLNGNKQ
jgi:tetratricopeptide (TPR) repeat protein